MLSKFWESIGSSLAERWLDYIFGPAFLFWGGGLAIYVLKTGWQVLLNDVQALTALQQGGIIVIALFILIASSLLIQSLHFPILRILEGYWIWPFVYVGSWLISIQKVVYKKKYARLNHLLKKKEELGELDSSELRESADLEIWIHWIPAQADELLPAPLGNILRARERAPQQKYGLDPIICWPRMWPLLPEVVRNDLSAARASLERLAEFSFWGILFMLWAFLSPGAILVGLIWWWIMYQVACQAAMAYGDLLETAFDLHRFLLYNAMGWPRPSSTNEEISSGEKMSEYLWRGTLSEPVIYPKKLLDVKKE